MAYCCVAACLPCAIASTAARLINQIITIAGSINSVGTAKKAPKANVTTMIVH